MLKKYYKWVSLIYEPVTNDYSSCKTVDVGGEIIRMLPVKPREKFFVQDCILATRHFREGDIQFSVPHPEGPRKFVPHHFCQGTNLFF